MDKNECSYVYWEETDYDIISGHSDYKPVCTQPSNKGERCYSYWRKYCKHRQYLETKREEKRSSKAV